MNQRTNPQQAKDPPTAKPQTPQPETKRQVLTGAQFTQRPPKKTIVKIKAPLKFNCPPNESLGDEIEPLLDKDIMPHILSAESPDKESKRCDKLNETGSPNESPLAKTPPGNPRTPPLTVPERKASPCETDSRRFGKRRFGKNMAADVSAKKYAETSQAKNICRNVSYDMWSISGVCTLVLTVAETSTHYDRFAIFVPARSLLLFDLA